MNQAPNNQPPYHTGNATRRDEKPWYKQFWPWFIIAFPATSVIVSLTILWLAITHPDSSVLNESEYRALKSELKAQPASDTEAQEAENQETESQEKTGKPGSQTTL